MYAQGTKDNRYIQPIAYAKDKDGVYKDGVYKTLKHHKVAQGRKSKFQKQFSIAT